LYYLRTLNAQLENQGLDRVKFIQDVKAVFFDQKFAPGAYNNDALSYPPSWGMNEKGSMNKEELENFFMNHFAKLFPSKADLPEKRVAVLINGGPGRTNLEMLAKLCLMGIFLLFPSGLPSTTALLQIMD
jgi:hypothetical protein